MTRRWKKIQMCQLQQISTNTYKSQNFRNIIQIHSKSRETVEDKLILATDRKPLKERNPFSNKSQLSKQTCVVTVVGRSSGDGGGIAERDRSRVERAATAIKELQRRDNSVTEDEQQGRR